MPGSNGKTSTKELTSAALGTRLSVYATRGNLNNHVGVPLTLLAIPDDADVAVVEIGTNHPGEVAALRAFVEPDVAIVTSIGEEHLEGLGDLAGVLREESAVFAGVGVAITPAAQPEVGEAARTLAQSTVSAGLRRRRCPSGLVDHLARRRRRSCASATWKSGRRSAESTTCGTPCSPLRPRAR